MCNMCLLVILLIVSKERMPARFTLTLHIFQGTLGNDSNGGGLSVTSSSAGLSRFSAAASASSEDTCLTGDILPTPNLKIYSFSDLKNATRNFKSDMVLGMGGFGTVFKGWVDEKTLAPAKYGTGMMVAIKKLNSESIQGFEEWQVIKLK